MEKIADKKDLFIFTNKYPYGSGETFIENELIVLSEKCKTIYIVPLSTEGESRAAGG